ncbi:glycoside hydrolase family 32 protein [Winogradskyella alexanderae]|uniref:Glycoside hydrolase family 32 protein n=1 Tax=Winogradskyella alexanderae TaxID=2877123 RepID=A0ABS7XT12_9FLAO|nr:glycoside hydrolase family 32 protein [Winogradskyella alexanderae]MCA0132519.1 glycoside hydrolase family 32 protein [Winogradskyella alexanderae]
MKFKYSLFSVLFGFLITITVGCKSETEKAPIIAENDEEFYRPNYHFTPKNNWMNDPNGMFYLNGKYHLYFQHHPDDNVWGPMHWGHAISEDLINFEEQPIALYPDDIGLIFSGSAVVDYDNTSGFGEDGKVPVVAIFTYHNMDGEKSGDIDFQTQAIAYSLDEGTTWTKYADNPVISNPGIKDFRDPKVFWDNCNSKWIMSLAAGNKIMFYSSANLKEWKFESDFGELKGEHGGVWECPDLFPTKIDGEEDKKWVLLVSINPSGPNGGSATQYFIGDFDGSTFSLDSDFNKQLEKNKAVWLDYGRDNYAGVTWSNIPEDDGRNLFIGWMSNWDYARDVPTYKWRSTMTIPRKLSLVKEENEFVVKSKPVKELDNFISRKDEIEALTPKDFNLVQKKNHFDLTRSSLNFELTDLKDERYELNLSNNEGDTLKLGLDNMSKQIFLDRTKSGKLDFSEKFAPNVSVVQLDKSLSEVQIEVVLDKTSIEVFINNGEIVLTELFFPNSPMTNLSILSEDDNFQIADITIKEFSFQ